MIKLKVTFTLLVLSPLVIAAGLIMGCKKEAQNESVTLTDSSARKFDLENLQVVTNTEAKVRDDFMAEIRASVLKGDFQGLEKSAENFRTRKERFESGYWKLRAFYLAFGATPENTGWPEWLGKLQQWKTQYSDSITPRLALAGAYCGYALAARGQDWGYKVSDEAAKQTDERLRASFNYLHEAKDFLNHENDYGFYGIVLRDCMWAGMGRTSYDKIFDSAIRNALDYNVIYEYKAYYLLPRWFGQRGEWQTFAKAMSERKDFPESDEIFGRCAIYLQTLGLFYEDFAYDDKTWEELKSSFHAIEKHYPESLEIKSIDCLLSTEMRDYKEAREQMILLGGKIDLSVWDNKGHFIRIAKWLNNDDATLEQLRQSFIVRYKRN